MTVRTVVITASGDTKEYEDTVRARGFEPLIEPLLAIEHVNMELPDLSGFTGLAFTSVHAIDSFTAQEKNRDFTVYTVGDATASYACSKGFKKVMSAQGTAADLEKIIPAAEKPRTLYLRGAHIAYPMDGLLAPVAYMAHPVEKLTPFCAERLESDDVAAILFFSRRGGENFTRLVRENRLEGTVSGIKALCLSGAVIESVSALPWQEIHAAGHPGRDAMLALLEARLDT